MNEFNAIFENDDSDNRLFDTKCPLHYAEGACFMMLIGCRPNLMVKNDSC